MIIWVFRLKAHLEDLSYRQHAIISTNSKIHPPVGRPAHDQAAVPSTFPTTPQTKSIDLQAFRYDTHRIGIKFLSSAVIVRLATFLLQATVDRRSAIRAVAARVRADVEL